MGFPRDPDRCRLEHLCGQEALYPELLCVRDLHFLERLCVQVLRCLERPCAQVLRSREHRCGQVLHVREHRCAQVLLCLEHQCDLEGCFPELQGTCQGRWRVVLRHLLMDYQVKRDFEKSY